MHRKLTDQQQHCVDTVLARMQEYLDLRYAMTARANPRMETVWPDLAWMHMTQLRNTLSNDKIWGPNRFVIGEILCSDDLNKIRELFTPTNQNTIQTEVVEKKDEVRHKTSDILDVHDFRTLYGSLDANIASIVSVVQVYMWWDLPDASELSRFDFKLDLIRRLSGGPIAQPAKEFYARAMKMEEGAFPSDEEILLFEMRRLKICVDRFTERRNAEPGYQVIIARRSTESDESADRLIGAIAREQVLLHTIANGGTIDAAMKQQFAHALHTTPEALTPAAEMDYLKGLIADHKKKLRNMMTTGLSGEPYNFKQAQADAIRRKFEEITAGHDLTEPKVEVAPAAGH